MKLITRRLTNGWLHCQCKTCGYVSAVSDLSVFRCSCPNNKVETPPVQNQAVSTDVENLEQKAEVPEKTETAKKSVKKTTTRRRRKPRAKKTEETKKTAE